MFYTKVKSQQLTSNVIGVTPAGTAAVNSFVTNLGGTEIKGLELDGSLLITERWEAQATFSWIDSKIETFLDNNQANLFSLNGAFSPRTPKYQASLASSYKGEFGNGLGWRVSGDVSYEGKKYGQVDNLRQTPAHVYVGARYIVSGDNWDITLWGKNLLDDDGPVDILRYVDLRGITPATLSTPAFGGVTPRGFVLSLPKSRQIGVTGVYKF